MPFTYSKDKKLKTEIEHAKLYDINWMQKRRALLKKNMQEMILAHPLIHAFNPPLFLNKRVDKYISDYVKGILNTNVYGYPEIYMQVAPDSIYTRNTNNYLSKYGGDKDIAFNTVNAGLNGVSFRDVFGKRGIYLKQGKSGSAAHEFHHAGSASAGTPVFKGGSYKYNPQHFAVVKYLKGDPYIQELINTGKLNWDAPIKSPTADNLNYVFDPDEVLARRQALMAYENWEPTRKALIEDVQRWRKKGLLGWSKPLSNNSAFYNTPNINFEKLSDETILHLINDVAQNKPFLNTPLVDNVYYAYKGGLIKKRKK